MFNNDLDRKLYSRLTPLPDNESVSGLELITRLLRYNDQIYNEKPIRLAATIETPNRN